MHDQTPRLVQVRQKVLKQNDVTARALRDRFHAAGVYVVSLVSSPGSGKTAFLERTLTLLAPRYRVAALVGDLATDNDAQRLARSGAPVRRVERLVTLVDSALYGFHLDLVTDRPEELAKGVDDLAVAAQALAIVRA